MSRDVRSRVFSRPVTTTIETNTNGATTPSRMMNISGYVVTVIFSSMFTIACCLVVELGLGSGLDLVSDWFVVMHAHLY